MRELQGLCERLEILDYLRNVLEHQRRVVILLGEDEALLKRFLFGLLRGTFGYGRTMIAARSEEDWHEMGRLEKPWHSTLIPDADGKPSQKIALQSFGRQDPDSIVVPLLETESLLIFFNLMTTGMNGGSMAGIQTADRQSFLALLETAIDPSFLKPMLTESCVVVELSGKVPRNAVRAISVMEKQGSSAEWKTLVQRKEPLFDLERDPDRKRAFMNELYEAHEDFISKKVWAPVQSHQIPVQMPATKPLPQDPLETENNLDESLQNWLSSNRQACYFPELKAEDLHLLKSLEDLSTQSAWPTLMNEPAILLLQVATDLFLKPTKEKLKAKWIQLFVARHWDRIQDLSQPFHDGFLVRRIQNDTDPLLTAGTSQSFFRESFPIQELRPSPLEYPDHEDQPQSMSPSLELPHHRQTKFLGHPTWMQSSERPNCPHCEKQMTFLMQFANDSLHDSLSGPDFVDGLYFCEDHLDTWAMIHQCS